MEVPMAEPLNAKLSWGSGLRFLARSDSGHQVAVDSTGRPGHAGPSPIELLLIAVAGCTAMDVVSILQKKREPLEALEVSVEGTRAHDHPKTYTDIQVVYRVRGQVRAKALEHAIELSETKYCSVGAMLGKSARITTRFEIEPGGSEAAKDK
jgi:putative redox protein